MNERRRLFLALWPEPGLQRDLYRLACSLAAGSQGRPVAEANVHLTLAFVGSVDSTQQACLEALLERVAAPAFSLPLDRLHFWRRSGVLCVAPAQPPEPLVSLQVALGEGVAACGLELDPRPFRPHVTLLRKARRFPREAELVPLVWKAATVALVASNTHASGVEYQVLQRRLLSG